MKENRILKLEVEGIKLELHPDSFGIDNPVIGTEPTGDIGHISDPLATIYNNDDLQYWAVGGPPTRDSGKTIYDLLSEEPDLPDPEETN